MFTFSVDGELPGLNEIIKAAKSHYGIYSTMKKKNGKLIYWCLERRFKEQSVTDIEPFHYKVDITCKWITKNLKKDNDNVSAGIKFILDSLTHAGVIKNDTRRYIGNITHKFGLDKENPRVEVTLTKHKEEKVDGIGYE